MSACPTVRCQLVQAWRPGRRAWGRGSNACSAPAAITSCDKVIEWSRIAFARSAEKLKLFATTHDRDAVVAQRASYQHLVARAAVRTGKTRRP